MQPFPFDLPSYWLDLTKKFLLAFETHKFSSSFTEISILPQLGLALPMLLGPSLTYLLK